MLAPILTAFLFAGSAIFSQRATRIFGSLAANFYRLVGACTVLGLITWATFTESVHLELFWWFFLSGLVGFGVGDVGLFLAYPRLGSRLTLLIHFCVSTVTGALGDYMLLGTTLTWWEALAAGLILLGLAVTLLYGKAGPRPVALRSGVAFALLSALGMGWGTALSHLAITKAEHLGLTVPGISQAWQRTTAGVLCAGLIFALVRYAQRRIPVELLPKLQKTRSGCTAAFWLGGTTLLGPVLGVSCYQWAIQSTGSSAIVLAVAASSTLIIIPLARWMEKDHASNSQIIGTLLAVAGVAWLCLLRK
jgi:drug/metabolite transporter (DMT)-like permease